jgi:hypothetical protein
MTRRQIILAQKKIEKSKSDGYFLEALIKNYHLNLEILKFISFKINPDKSTKNLKAKELLSLVIDEIHAQPKSKIIISKKNLKMLKPWLVKMDFYLKTLKMKSPTNTKSLLHECEKIFAVLNISLAKIHIGDKK